MAYNDKIVPYTQLELQGIGFTCINLSEASNIGRHDPGNQGNDLNIVKIGSLLISNIF